MTNQRRHRQPSLAALARAAGDLAAPPDYYRGRRSPALPIPDNIVLFCRRSAAELHDGTWQPHFHHRWVLAVPLAGTGTVLVDEGRFRLRPGQTLLVPPLRLHRYHDIGRGRIRWLFVTFELPGEEAATAVPVAGELSPDARRLLGEVIRLWRTGAPPRESAASLAVQTALLVLAVRHPAPGLATVEPTPPAALLRAVNDWLHAHRDGPVMLAALARGIGRSESHLRAVFR